MALDYRLRFVIKVFGGFRLLGIRRATEALRTWARAVWRADVSVVFPADFCYSSRLIISVVVHARSELPIDHLDAAVGWAGYQEPVSMLEVCRCLVEH